MPRQAPAATIGRPKDLVKRQAILEAAKSLFLKHGFDGSSMDSIALEAGVSKLTVYNHFHDKENLFIAAVEAHCENQLPALDFELKEETPIEQALLVIATRFQSVIYSDEGLELHRLMCGSTQQNPSLVRNFYQAGPARVQAHMTSLLSQAHQQQKLIIPDSKFAAENFLSLFSGCLHMRVLFEIESKPTPEELTHIAQKLVKRFVKAYAYASE